MNIKHKHFAIRDFKTDDEARTVEGWASTFGNKDQGADIILPGAFTKSLATRNPKMLWQHNSDELIGVWDAAKETDRGLYVKGRFADTPRGNEAYTLAKMGALDSMSIGYSTLDYEYDPKTGTRTLKELELWEVSLVTFPMNEMATITNVKAAAEDVDAACDMLEQAAGMCDAYAAEGMTPTAETMATVCQMLRGAMGLLSDEGTDEDTGEGKSKPATERDLEKHLRDAGYSRTEAKKIVSEGYKALSKRRDGGADEPTLLRELRDVLTTFRI